MGERKGIDLSANAGGPILFDLNGGGTGKFTVGGGVADLAFEATTPASSAKAAGAGLAVLRSVTAGAAMRQATMPAVQANGVLDFHGLGGLVLNALGGQASSRLDIGTGFGKPAVLALKSVADVDVDVRAGVKLLTVGEWLDTGVGGRDGLTAPFVKDVFAGPVRGGVTGDFEADLTVDRTGPNGYGINKVAVAGTLRDANWTVGGTEVDVKDVYAGAAEDCRQAASGHVGRLVIGTDLTHSDPFADTLYARTFGTIKVAGDVNAGSIVAAGAGDAKTNIAIKDLDVRTVTGLPRLTAAASGTGSGSG